MRIWPGLETTAAGWFGTICLPPLEKAFGYMGFVSLLLGSGHVPSSMFSLFYAYAGGLPQTEVFPRDCFAHNHPPLHNRSLKPALVTAYVALPHIQRTPTCTRVHIPHLDRVVIRGRDNDV